MARASNLTFAGLLRQSHAEVSQADCRPGVYILRQLHQCLQRNSRQELSAERPAVVNLRGATGRSALAGLARHRPGVRPEGALGAVHNHYKRFCTTVPALVSYGPHATQLDTFGDVEIDRQHPASGPTDPEDPPGPTWPASGRSLRDADATT